MIDELFNDDSYFWQQVTQTAEARMTGESRQLLSQLTGHRKKLFARCMQR